MRTDSGSRGISDEWMKTAIYIVGRKKDVINSGGYNVYGAGVEAVLAAHPLLLMSAVVGIPHEEWGESVHAEVLLKDGAEATEEEIKGFCQEKLARYKAPKSIAFVNELPTSTAGKVLRRKVRKKHWEGKDRRVN